MRQMEAKFKSSAEMNSSFAALMGEDDNDEENDKESLPGDDDHGRYGFIDETHAQDLEQFDQSFGFSASACPRQQCLRSHTSGSVTSKASSSLTYGGPKPHKMPSTPAEVWEAALPARPVSLFSEPLPLPAAEPVESVWGAVVAMPGTPGGQKDKDKDKKPRVRASAEAAVVAKGQAALQALNEHTALFFMGIKTQTQSFGKDGNRCGRPARSLWQFLSAQRLNNLLMTSLDVVMMSVASTSSSQASAMSLVRHSSVPQLRT